MNYLEGSYEIPMEFQEGILEAEFKLSSMNYKVIIGTAVDEFNNPIDSAVVEIFQKIEDKDNINLKFIGSVLSDVTGKFIFGPVQSNITVIIKIFKSNTKTIKEIFISDNQSGDDDDKDYVGPGRYETNLCILDNSKVPNNAMLINAGTVAIWNTKTQFFISIDTIDDWNLSDVRIYVGSEPVPVSKDGNFSLGHFPYKKRFSEPASSLNFILDIKTDLGIIWNQKNQESTFENIVIYTTLIKYSADGYKTIKEKAFAYGNNQPITKRGWWTRYLLSRPLTGHFIDSAVSGIKYNTSSYEGITDDKGAFNYLPEETVTFSIDSLELGSSVGKKKVTPLDLINTNETEDKRVINMAKLIQSLDAKGDPTDNISITEPVINCFHQAINTLNIDSLDFNNSQLIDNIIDETIDYSTEIQELNLKKVLDKEAHDNLEKGLKGSIFRKNISKTPEMKTAKAKIEIMPVYVPAFKANGDSVTLDYKDEEEKIINTREEVKPLVVVYADEIPDTGGAMDVFAAVSRDEGNSWKKKNLSRSADQSSFKLANGTEYPGDVKKPQCKIKGNKILVTWTSKYAKKGKPRYSIKPDDPEYIDIYEDDIWGVSGSQKSFDYTELNFPEVGEIPFSCVWTCRGIIDKDTGDITWFNAERLTSGRRDACQLMANGSNNVGFAVTWQEDPEGLRPGEQAGPGEGWSGATTNHKTDIWYSYIKWDDFDIIKEEVISDEDIEEDEEDKEGRPKVKIPFSLPVRISDNDVVNTDNMKVIKDEQGNWVPETNEDGKPIGSHRYGYELEGLWDGNSLYEKTNPQGETKQICITTDDRLLDGDTGASRPNVMLQPYTNKDGEKSAWAILCYEETKGVGSGPPEETGSDSDDDTNKDKPEDGDSGSGQDRYYPDRGKNVIYHSFDFSNPDLVSAGTILNPQCKDEKGELLFLVDKDGKTLLDFNGDPIPAYENARRPRFIIQSKKNALIDRDGKDLSEGTVLVCVFKMGEEGKGRPSDIFMRRWTVKTDSKGNPYAFENLEDEIQNISSVTPTETFEKEHDKDKEKESDNEDKRDAVKVLRWEQAEENLNDSSSTNIYDDARAHRGFIRGDFLAIAYDWTPNWAAARNGNDIYNLYIRRSFDGGATWTTDPNGEGVEHLDIFSTKDSNETHEKVEVTTKYGPGEFEPSRNVSQLRNSKQSVIEPRLVGTPGTIKVDDKILFDDDKQDIQCFWVTYGTESNPGRNSEEEKCPLDIYYSYSTDYGETYKLIKKTIKPDGDSSHAGEEIETWDWLAKDTGKKTAEQAECQIRMTPDGSIFYAVWNETSSEDSDVMFRRIMRDDGDIEIKAISS